MPAKEPESLLGQAKKTIFRFLEQWIEGDHELGVGATWNRFHMFQSSITEVRVFRTFCIIPRLRERQWEDDWVPKS